MMVYAILRQSEALWRLLLWLQLQLILRKHFRLLATTVRRIKKKSYGSTLTHGKDTDIHSGV